MRDLAPIVSTRYGQRLRSIFHLNPVLLRQIALPSRHAALVLIAEKRYGERAF